MGTYGCTVDDVIDKFEDFLQECEGDVSAVVIAKCWNILARKNKWNDNLKAIDKFTKKEIKW